MWLSNRLVLHDMGIKLSLNAIFLRTHKVKDLKNELVSKNFQMSCLFTTSAQIKWDFS